MNSSSPIFLTNQSDYNSLVLFRHVCQSLAATQTGTVEAFCTVAASKPGTEFHYLGLLWDCAFKAGMGAHSEPITHPPTTTTASSPPKFSVLPQSFTRDFSVLCSGSEKPVSTLRRRFRRPSRMQKQSAPVLTVPLQTEISHPPSDSFRPHPIPVPPLITSTPTSPHSEPTSLPPVAANPTSPEVQPTPTRDFSALRPSTRKPFGSLHRRFRRRL